MKLKTSSRPSCFQMCMYKILNEKFSVSSVVPLQGFPNREHPSWSPVGGCMAPLVCYLYLAQCSHVTSQSLLQTNKRQTQNTLCHKSWVSRKHVLYRWRFTLLKRKKTDVSPRNKYKNKTTQSTIAQMINTKFRNRLSVPELITATCGLLHGFSWTLSHWEKLNGLLDLL